MQHSNRSAALVAGMRRARAGGDTHRTKEFCDAVPRSWTATRRVRLSASIDSFSLQQRATRTHASPMCVVVSEPSPRGAYSPAGGRIRQRALRERCAPH
jgi:hypothetical protein